MDLRQNLIAFLIFEMAIATIIAQDPTIDFVSASMSQYVRPYGSQAGGQVLYIKGTNFPSSLNMISILVGPYPCLPTHSNPFFIQCQTTKAIYIPQSTRYLALTLSIQGKNTIKCSKYACQYFYSSGLTPFLQEFYNRNLYGGENLNIFGYHDILNIGNGITPALSQVRYILIGNAGCRIYNVTQPGLVLNSVSNIVCQVDTRMASGEYNISYSGIYGFPNMTHSIQALSLYTFSQYMVRVLSHITGIVNSSSGAFGRLLTLHGSFPGLQIQRSTCEIGNIACEIISYNQNQINIAISSYEVISPLINSLQANSQGNEADCYLGGFGFRYARYKFSKLYQFGDLYRMATGSANLSLTLEEERIVTQLSTPYLFHYSYVQTFKGFLFIPVEGQYRFQMSCDDSCIVKQSSVANSTNPSNLKIIMNSSLWIKGQTNPFTRPNQNNIYSYYFNASGYYYTQAYSMNNYGEGYFRLSIATSNLTLVAAKINPAADTNQIKSGTPQYKIQTFNITPTYIEPEVIQVAVNLAALKYRNDTSFNLYILKTTGIVTQQLSSPPIHMGDSAQVFGNKVNQLNPISFYNPQYNLIMQKSNGQIVNTISEASFLVYEIIIYLTRSAADQLPLQCDTAGIVITLKQAHSAPIAGFYSILLNGIQLDVYGKTQISSTTQDYDLEHAFNVFYNSSEVNVNQVSETQLPDQIVFTIYYIGIEEPLPLTLDTSRLTGGINSTFTQEVTTNRNYSGAALFYDIVPLQFLRTAEKEPSLTLTVNDLPIICQNCYFHYDPSSTPTVNFAILNGTSLHLGLTDNNNVGFSLQDIVVTVSEAECSIFQGTISSFTCELTNSNGRLLIEAGQFIPLIHVSQIGYANTSSILPLSIPFLFQRITPDSNDLSGGISNISALGLPSKLQNLTVIICGNLVDNFVLLNQSLLQIGIPPSISSGCSGETFLSFSNVITYFNFTYFASGYGISSLSVTSLHPFIAQSIQISGHDFPSPIEVSFVSNNDNAYNLPIVSANDSLIVCSWQGGLSGTYYAQLKYRDETPSYPDLTIEVGIFIDSVSPTTGSFGGGYSLFISGLHFLLQSQTQVHIGSAENVCQIVFMNTTIIECSVPSLSNEELGDKSVTIIVITRGVAQSVCRGDCQFTYDSNLTIFTTPLLQNNFLAGQTVTIQLNVSSIEQLFVDTNSYPFSMTNNILSFAYPSLQFGFHYIGIMANGSLLYPPIQTYTNLSHYWKLSLTSGSTAGGFVNITGNGMGGAINRPPIQIILLCGSSQSLLPLKYASPNTVTVVLPPQSAQTCTISYIWNLYSYSFSYSYKNASTPSIFYTWISNYTYKITENQIKPLTYNSATFVLLDVNGVETNQEYVMKIIANSSTVFYITPASGYLPAGGYRLRAYAQKYGFAAISNISSIIYQPFLDTLTSTPTLSSFNGGKLYQILGKGFVKSENQNEIKICGLRSQVVSVDQSSITIRIPPLVSRSTIQRYGLGSEFILRGSWFADTPENLQLVNDNALNTFYSSVNSICYVGIDTGSKVKGWFKKVRFTPNLNWVNTSSQLMGALFEVSNDFVNWDLLFEIDSTLVHFGINYWLNVNQAITPYRYIRFRHNMTSMCQLAELEVIGIFLVDDNQLNNYVCQIDVNTYNSTVTLPTSIVFTQNQTAVVESLTPPYGPNEGGSLLTITGTNFNSNFTVLIDDVECVLVNSSQTSISCLTGPRVEYNKENTFILLSNGNTAVLRCQPFLYVNPWSSYSSWLGQIPPVDNENITIHQGTNLLIDEDTAILNTIIIQKGKIIIADTKLAFRFSTLLINEGEIRVGNYSTPFSSELDIEIYKSKFTAGQIVCNNCKFRVFGQPPESVWVELAQSISIGDSSLSVNASVDWYIGQTIIIASSSFDLSQCEQKTIIGLEQNNRTIKVDSPFAYHHFGSLQQYNSQTVNLRAEVGLISRNIRIKSMGTVKEGTSILFNGSKGRGLQIHASSFEIYNCGAPGLGCITINGVGEMNGSFLSKLSVHHTHSRMITIEGADYLKIDSCLGYNISGNGISLQSGSEINNVITNNVVVNVLNNFHFPFLDIDSSAYFISNPYNQISNNRAAGGEFCGFHFLFPQTSELSSINPDLCPTGSKVLQISNNVAHSNAQFGFRLYKLAGRKFPCLSMQNQSLLNPYTSNPSIWNEITNIISYKNRYGFVGEQLGNLELTNFVVSDNGVGIQIHVTNYSLEAVTLRNPIIIGYLPANFETSPFYDEAIGLITARTDGLLISGARFYSFSSSMTVIQSCSQCEIDEFLVSGGRTTIFEDVAFQNILGSYVKWNSPKREIFVDLDGSLTLQLQQILSIPRQKATISPFRQSLLEDDSCFQVFSSSWNDTVFCKQNISIRSILFANFIPAQQQNINIRKLEDPYENISSETNLRNYSVQPYFSQLASMDIQNTWSLPFLTNAYYNVHWGLGLDFTHLSLGLNLMWSEDDSLVLRFNTTAFRQGFFVNKYYKQQIIAGPLQQYSLISPTNCSNGQFYFNTNEQYLFVCVSGRGKQMREWIDLNTTDCFQFCSNMAQAGMQSFLRTWSNSSQWPNQQLPRVGDNVTIPAQWNVLLDIDPPELYFVQINGNLIFDRTRSNLFKVHIIWVHLGKIWIGTPNSTFYANATIQLVGNEQDPEFTIGNIRSRKMLVVTGGLQFYGIDRVNYWSKLIATAESNSSNLEVQNTEGWREGDRLIITTTYASQSISETAQISSINGTQVILTQPLIYQHFGSAAITISNRFGSIDRRSIVAVLSRNIKLISGPSAGYGGKILIASILIQPVDSPYLQNIFQTGYVNMFAVEIANFGVNQDSAVTFLDLAAFGPNSRMSSIIGSVIYQCTYRCLYISRSTNISITSNIFAFSTSKLVEVKKVDSFYFTDNLLVPSSLGSDLIAYHQSYPLSIKNSLQVSNNIVVCSNGGIGYYAPYANCDTNPFFTNNVAGLCKIGFYLYGNTLFQCLKTNSLLGYGNSIAIYSKVAQKNSAVVFSNLFLVDNQISIAGNFPTMNLQNNYLISNSYFNAISNQSHPSFYSNGSACYEASLFDFDQPKPNEAINLENMFQFLPSYGVISVFNSEMDSYNSGILPFCSRISIFRYFGDYDFSMLSIYLTNVSRINNPNEDLLHSDEVADQTTAYPSIISDTDGTFTGSEGTIAFKNYWTKALKCPNISENTFLCPKSIAVLEFESISPDCLNRTLSPIKFTHILSKSTFSCKLSKYFTTIGSLFTFNRFSTSVLVNQSYQISYSGSPPIDSLYSIQNPLSNGSSSSFWLHIIIKYESFNYVSVYASNDSGVDILVKPNTIRTNETLDLTLQANICGANAYHYEQGSIEVILNSMSECQIRVIGGSYLIISAVTDSSLQHFDQESFVKALAVFLGIDWSRIRLVDLRSSSLQMTIYITAQIANRSASYRGTNETKEVAEFSTMSLKLKQLNNANQSFINAGKLLSFSSTYVIVSIDKASHVDNQQPSLETGAIIGMCIIISIIIFIVIIVILRNRKRVYSVENVLQENEEIEAGSMNQSESGHQLENQENREQWH